MDSMFCFIEDLLDDGASTLLDRIRRTGLEAVTLAASYHATRDIFPGRASSAIRYLPSGVTAFQPRAERYGLLRPAPHPALDGRDLLAELVDSSAERGMAAGAWAVILHNSRLGHAHPEVTVRNALGARLRHWLCPAHPEVRAYATTLCSEIAGTGVQSIALEAMAAGGFDHGETHERALIHLGPTARFLLGLCLCEHCRRRAGDLGVDAEALAARVAEVLRGVLASHAYEARLPALSQDALSELLGPELTPYLSSRAQTITTLAGEVSGAVSDQAPRTRLTLLDASGAVLGYATGRPDTYRPATDLGWHEGLDLAALGEHVDIGALCYFADPHRIEAEIAAYDRLLPPSSRLEVVLRPTWPDATDAPGLTANLAAAGHPRVGDRHFYTYGLLRDESFDWIQQSLPAPPHRRRNHSMSTRKSPDAAVEGTTNSRRLPAYIALCATLIGTVYGYDTGSISSAILFIGPEYDLTPFTTTLVVSSVTFGTLAGALIAGWIANAIGRKRTMLTVALCYTVFTAGQALAVDEWSLIAVRLLLGLVVGISIVTAPLFISESAPRRFRGRLLVTFQFATVTGIVVAFFVGLALSSTENWRLILAIGFIPALIASIMLSRLPDTSRWYIMKGRDEEALAVLSRVEPDEDPRRGAELIRQDLALTEQGTYRQLFSGKFRRAGIFVVGLGLFVQLTGINAVVYYSPILLQDVGFEAAGNALLIAALIQLAGLLATVTAFFVIDRWGRRPVLMTGLSIMVIANALLVIGFLLDNAQVMTVIGLFIFLIGYSFGYGALLWVYIGEALPAQLRAIGGSALLTADLFANIVIAMFFLNALNAIGGAMTFGVFLVLSIGALIFCFLLAPEIKGRRLEDVAHYWENGAKWPSDEEIAARRAEQS